MNKVEKTIVKDVYMLKGDHLECSEDYCYCNDSLYFSKEMVENNLFIISKTLPIIDDVLLEGDIELQLSIQLIHVTDINVKFNYLYEGNELSTIQEQIIVKEVATLFSEHSLRDFIEYTDSLSVGIISTTNIESIEERKFFKLQGIERLRIIKQHIQEAV